MSLAMLMSGGSGPATGRAGVPTAAASSVLEEATRTAHTLKAVLYSDNGRFAVMPAHMNVVTGDTITFSNFDSVSRNLVLVEAPNAISDSGRTDPIETSSLPPKGTFSHQFTKPGIYEVFDPAQALQKTHIAVSERETEETRNSLSFSQTVASDMEEALASESTARLISGAGAGDADGPGTQEALQTAAVVPGTTCPVDAPVKTFSVLAIDVDITLNRFGWHDPDGKMYTLEDNLAAVRAQETAALPNRVSIGLRDDPIQPLTIRANLGDCLQVTFKNQLTTSNKPASISLRRGAVDPSDSGTNVGNNGNSIISPGESTVYTWYLVNKPEMEGTYYFNSHGDMRFQTDHGLFGALVAEPEGSTYLHPKSGAPLTSGWEAMIVPPTGKAFREFAIFYHEIGDETYILKDATNGSIPVIDEHTGVYRPGARALNYRSEPHGLRLSLGGDESQAYGSYAFGDPPTPMPISYLGDPYKTRLIHGGGEVFHSHHYHGGTVRWPINPKADPAFAVQRGFDKAPPLLTQSTRIDVQNIGPSETYELEHECANGGCQQQPGEFLYHCHFPNHYVGGMWSFFRVHNTLQPNLKELPDRQDRIARAVNSLGLIGKALPSGRVLTSGTLDSWVESLLPPQGITSGYDATVYDWVKEQRPEGPLYFKEPDDTRTWPDYTSATPGQRPQIMFDPNTGLLEFPFLTPHLAKRPPFAPGAHGPAPYLSSAVAENDLPTNSGFTTQPADPNRPNDALCPAGIPVKRFNIVGLPLSITYDKFNEVDTGGQIFVLAEDLDDILAGLKPAEPLIIRTNARDCVYVNYVSRMLDTNEVGGFSKTNLHPHFYQFDTQASDGVITGFSYEQSLRPYPAENRTLTQNAAAGSGVINVSNVTNLRPGIWIGVGLGKGTIELHKIASINGTSITLVQPLVRDHPTGEAVGVEFVNYAWYPDVTISTVFAHDHVFGTHSWGHGLVSALVVEPPGSTYHHPVTGQEIRSGPISDIHTQNPMAIDLPGQSFRETVITAFDTNFDGGGSFNLRRAPFDGRLGANGDKSLLYSSVTHGDPETPLVRAYEGDPTVFRYLQTGTNEAITFHLTGHEWRIERFPNAMINDVAMSGIAERFDLILEGGAARAGDYLYYNAEKDHMEEGMWGIFRVHDKLRDDLRPLPGRATPPGGQGFPTLTTTGGRPPAVTDPGDPCPAASPLKQFNVVALTTNLTINSKFGISQGSRQLFALASEENDILAGIKRPSPLVLWAAMGDCLQINLTNKTTNRVSLHTGLHTGDPQRSQGITVGYDLDESVTPGGTITYKVFAEHMMSHGMLMDMANGTDGWDAGLYGAISIGEHGSRFYDPDTNTEVQSGWQVVVKNDHVPSTLPKREFVLFFQEQEPLIGKNQMPYRKEPRYLSLINYRMEPLARRLATNPDTSKVFNSTAHGDPDTPILRTYVGEPVTIHVMQGSGFQTHTFFVDGHSYSFDKNIAHADEFGSRMFGPLTPLHVDLTGGAGGPRRLPGDYLLGNHRLPFLEAGQWGILRVLSPGASSLPQLPNNIPTAGGDEVRVDTNSSNNPINVLANDTDPDGTPLFVEAVTRPVNGRAVVGPDGINILYTPNAGFTGTDTLSYIATDGSKRVTANVVVSVRPANRAPTPTNDTVNVARGSSGNILSLLTNDADPDSNPLTITSVTQPANGTATRGADGTNVIYTPNPAFAGPDSFTYTVSDGSVTATGTVSVTVSVATTGPTGAADSVTVPQDSVNNPINVLANDSDPGGNPIFIVSVTQAANGGATIITGGTGVLYTPSAGFAGTDSFTYTLSNGALTKSATVTVTVGGTNNAPVAGGDSVTVLQDSSNSRINVLANDSDPEGNPLAVTAVGQPGHGSAAVASGRSGVLYTPVAGFTGTDTFSYMVSDGALTSTGAIIVTVNRVGNNAPMARGDTNTVTQNASNSSIDVLANDSDPDGDAVSVSSVTQGTNGTVTVGSGGANIEYSPASGFLGTDSFTYTISDGLVTSTATVTVNVQRSNAAPTAVNDSVIIARNSASNAINVLGNDSDPDAQKQRLKTGAPLGEGGEGFSALQTDVGLAMTCTGTVLKGLTGTVESLGSG